MLRLRLLLAATAVMISNQAHASQYAWCHVSRDLGGNKYVVYLSGIVEVEEGTDAYLAFRDGPFSIEFNRYVNSTHDKEARGRDCSSAKSLREAQKDIAATIFAMSHWEYVKTEWTGGRPKAVDGGEGSTRPQTGIIIGAAPSDQGRAPTNSAAASRQRQEDNAARAAKVRQRAQEKAKAAAEAVKANAELQSKLAKLKEEMRKRCGGAASQGKPGACAQ